MQGNDAAAIVTVGIPFLNAEKYLEMAITSVFAQTLANWQLILIDDGSSDDSLEIARSFTTDPRVTVVSDGMNLGLAARLNQISEVATTPFLARMDADDLMSTFRLEMQVTYILQHAEIDLTATGLISMSDACDYQGHRFSPWSSASTCSFLMHKTSIAHATVLGRTEWFIRNPYRSKFERSEDIELWVRATERKDLKIAFLADNLYFYREFESTASQKTRASIKSHRRIAREYPMTFRERSRVSARLALAHTISVLSTSRLVRTLIQRRRNSNIASSENRELFEIELLKVSALHSSLS